MLTVSKCNWFFSVYLYLDYFLVEISHLNKKLSKPNIAVQVLKKVI